MGYSRCSVPGCSSRPGQGVLFKCFPKDQKIGDVWRRHLPGVRLSVHTAVCEKHFDELAFERVREDGTRKLRRDAVPRALPTHGAVSPERPMTPFTPVLKNITNVMAARNLWQAAPPTPLTPAASTTPPTAAFSPPKESSLPQPMTPVTPMLQDITNVMAARNLWQAAPPTPLTPAASTTPPTAAFSPAKESSLPQPMTPVTPMLQDITNVMAARNLWQAAPPTPLTPAASGITPTAAFSPAKELPTPLTPAAFGIPPAPKCLSNLEDSAMIELEGKVSLQDELIKRLNEERLAMSAMLEQLKKERDLALQQKNEAVQELGQTRQVATRGVKAYYSMKRRYLSQQKVKARLQRQIDRDTWSPFLHPTQRRLLSRKNARGINWDPSMIRKGLILKMKCGTTGYKSFVEELPLFPSVRTLQEAVQFIKFHSGFLLEVLDYVEAMVKKFPDLMKDCSIVVDELAIAQGIRYDPSLKQFVGDATFPTHTGRATKALLVLLAGVAWRWKITIAVYFTNKQNSDVKGSSACGDAFKGIIEEAIVRANKTGLKVCAVQSDMGADNLAMWRAFGVGSGRNDDPNATICIPGNEAAPVQILPDPVHIMKAIKAMLENNVLIYLSQEIVEEENLPTNVVSYRHIQDLMEFEEGFQLKVAFRLRPAIVNCKKHFAKMKVSTSRAVICHRTSVGLEALAEEKEDPSYKTTAFFIDILNTFFDIVTNRSKALAVSKYKVAFTEKCIGVIRKVQKMFHTMRVGASWKPCQRGIVILCEGLLNLIEYFLHQRNYSYLLLGRFTSDCIENLISMIRLAQPVPHAVALLHNLKVITLSQISEAVAGSSYDYEEAQPMGNDVDLLEVIRKKALERARSKAIDSLEELQANPIEKITQSEFQSISRWERCVIYDMAGSVIHHLKSNSICCPNCVRCTLHSGQEKHPYSRFTRMKEFTHLRTDTSNALLLSVSDEVFVAVFTAEMTLRKYIGVATKFKCADVLDYFVDGLMYVWEGTTILDCHKICRKILSHHIQSRFKEYGRKERETLRDAAASNPSLVQRSSQSAAMREAADKMTGAQRRPVRV